MGDDEDDPDGPILVFDGSCGFCEATSRWLIRRSGFSASRRRPFQAFGGRQAERLLGAGIRNEILLLDPRAGEITKGAAAILSFLRGGRLGWLARALGPVPLLPFLYRVVSDNRRILSPVSPAVSRSCGCDPAPRPGTRVAFVLACLVLGGLEYVLALLVAGPRGVTGFALGVPDPDGMLLGQVLPWIVVLPCSFLMSRGATARFAWFLTIGQFAVLVLAVEAALLGMFGAETAARTLADSTAPAAWLVVLLVMGRHVRIGAMPRSHFALFLLCAYCAWGIWTVQPNVLRAGLGAWGGPECRRAVAGRTSVRRLESTRTRGEGAMDGQPRDVLRRWCREVRGGDREDAIDELLVGTESGAGVRNRPSG